MAGDNPGTPSRYKDEAAAKKNYCKRPERF
jgi:hypothetical protein